MAKSASKDDHPFWKDAKPPIAIAHRGGAASLGDEKYRRENTLEVFRNSVELGYVYIEMDVIASADKKVIVIHVAKNKFEAAQRKKAAPDYQTLEKMSYTELTSQLKREIPTLEEVFKTFPNNKFLIDAKTDFVVEPLAKLIIRQKVEDRICVGSFYPERILRLHQFLGDKISYRINLSRSPLHYLKQRKYLSKLDFLSAVDFPYILLSRSRITGLHKKGLKVLVWTPNSEKKIKKALGLGADGIISDNIELLKRIVLKNDTNYESFI